MTERIGGTGPGRAYRDPMADYTYTRNDPEADDMEALAVKVFGYYGAESVESGDYRLVMYYLLSRGKTGTAVNIHGSLIGKGPSVSERLDPLFAEAAFSAFAAVLAENDRQGLDALTGCGELMDAMERGSSVIPGCVADYVSDCEDYDTLSNRLKKLETAFDGRQPLLDGIAAGAFDKAMQILQDNAGRAYRPDSLRRVIEPFTFPEPGNCAAALCGPEYRQRASEIALDRLKEAVIQRLNDAMDINEIPKIADNYNMADIVRYTPDFKRWYPQAVYSRALELAIECVSGATDATSLRLACEDVAECNYRNVTSDPAYTEVVAAKSLELTGSAPAVAPAAVPVAPAPGMPVAAEAPIVAPVPEVNADGLMDCSTVQELNDVLLGLGMNALSDQKVIDMYIARASEILGLCSSVSLATDNYVELAEEIISTDYNGRLCKAYCDSVFSTLLMPGSPKDAWALSKNPDVANKLATMTVDHLEAIRPDCLSAWIEYFEDPDTPKSPSVEGALATLRARADSQRNLSGGASPLYTTFF